jgi:nucleotide-binding universal stress UspA family protein
VTVVIVATNDSPACRRAVERVGEIFAGSTVVVATVVRPGAGPHSAPIPSPGRAATCDIERQSAMEAVETACEQIGPRAWPALLSGEPVAELCDLARRSNAAVIVVGSLGAGPLAAALGGSVGAELRARAPCSVVELGVGG